MEEEVGQDDTELVAAFLAKAKDQDLTDEEAGALIGRSRGAVQKWRSTIEGGGRVGVNKETRKRLKAFLFSGGSLPGIDRYREGASAVLRELRDFLDALEKRMGGE